MSQEKQFEFTALKRQLACTQEEQEWAKDTVARAFSSKFEGKNSNLMLIGPKGCGKEQMLRTISEFLHVPLLIIHDAHQLRSQASPPGVYISLKLLEHSSFDIERASSGVVVFGNVNHLDVDSQRLIAGLVRDGVSFKIREMIRDRCPAELYDEEFSTRALMFVATIECDIEGKIARRFHNDVIARSVDRANVLGRGDLTKLGVCQELAELFNFIAPFHARYHQLLRTPLCRL